MRPRRLASRLLVVALVQVALMAIAAVVVFTLTLPPHGRQGHGPDDDIDDSVDEAVVALASSDDRGDGLRRRLAPLLTLGIGTLVLVTGSVLTARWIVRPVEQLSRHARAIGDGDLGARTGLARDDELGGLATRLDEMAEQLERLMARERELLANVADELRTPLARIGVALDLASEGDAHRARASLTEIAIDVAELEVIVDDVLTVFRSDPRRGIVEAHGGTIALSSTVGEGTRARISVPAA